MNYRVGVTLAHFKIVLQKLDLFHVLFVVHGFKLLHPVIDWLPILLLDRRKVGGWAFYFFSHRSRIIQAAKRPPINGCARKPRHPVAILD